MARTDESDKVDGLVAQAVEEYFRRSQRGERPQIDEFAEQYPEIGDLLRTVIPALQAAEGPFDASADGDVASEHHKQLGDFRILRQIGRGGMGIVYEAEQISMTRRVALKVLPLAGLVDELKIRRFQNEVRAVAALDHPNIVPVYIVGEERGVHYYAMRLIRGRSLSEVLSSLRHVREEGEGLDGASMSQITSMGRVDDAADLNATREFDQVARPELLETVAKADSSTIPHSSRQEYFRSVAVLGIQAATALQHAHDEGIVHRDIKPANLLLDGSAQLYITDFGLARIESDAGVTMTGDLIGTLRYMAPEQALGKRVVVDHRADIYSLAATLYELLTLQPAYVAEDRRELLEQIAFEEPTRLRRIDADIPTELETIVHKAMSKDRHQRYASAQDLADDLQSHLEHRPIKAKPPTLSETIGKWTRRNPILTWASIITLSLVTITLAVSTLLISNQRDIAEDRLVRATTAERAATKAHAEATSQAGKLARRVYLMHIANADKDLFDSNYLSAQDQLDACPQDQRGWEWEFLGERKRATFPLSLPAGSPIFTRDGKRLIGSGPFGTPEQCLVKTWDLESRKVVSEIRHGSRVGSLAESTSEKRIAVGDHGGNLTVWDAKSRSKLWSVKKLHDQRVASLAFSPDDLLIASASDDRTLVIIDASNREVRSTFGPFDAAPQKVMFSQDGHWLLSRLKTGEETAMLINVAKREIVAQAVWEEGDYLPTFDRSGQRIATANEDGSIKLWNWDGKQLDEGLSWPASDQQITLLAFNTDGTRLASTDKANTVRVWNVMPGETVGKPLVTLESRSQVFDLAFRPNENEGSGRDEQILLGSVTSGVRLWRWRGGENGRAAKSLDGAAEARFSPDAARILVSTPMYYDGSGLLYRGRDDPYYKPERATILDAESGKIVATTTDAVYAASWLPDGREIIATHESGDAIRTYDAATGERMRDFPGNPGRFTISRVDPSGRRVVSFSDETIRVLNFESHGEELVRKIDDVGEVFMALGADFSRDANLMGLGRNGVEIWDTRSGMRVSTHPQPGHWAKRFVFSNDGKHVFVGSSGGLLTQLDVLSGLETKRFAGHSGFVRAIALAPDEQQIVSGDTLGRVIVWDVASEQPLITLTTGDQIITSLDWSSDGRRIVAGKEDGTIQIWTLPRSN